jgi:hypothetical protein
MSELTQVLVERVDLDEVELPSPMPDDDLLALDEALDRLASVDRVPRK